MDIAGEHIAGLQLLDAVRNANENSDNVNISDVLDAVAAADPATFGGGVASADSMAHPPPMQLASVEIIEQPAPKALRFRYECEGRSAGSLPGVNSKPENKTYPTIRINNYVGQATIVVSCVTKDEPYRPHPHNLVGRDGCQRGVFTFRTEITEDTRNYSFRNIGIQCVKKRDIVEALQTRATLRVDPFRTGFEHRNNPQSIDLNSLRLAFQVFLHGAGEGGRLVQLRPVVSDVISDKKASADLVITRSSHCSGPVTGGTQLILLCDKVTREDVVLFYQEDPSGQVLWEAVANTVLVHKQVAIVIDTPRYTAPHYRPREHRGHIEALFCLKRTTDGERSNSLFFEYIPDFQGTARKPPPDLAAIAAALAGADAGEPMDEAPATPPATPLADPQADARSLSELLEQVAELDEIYSASRTRREEAGAEPRDADDFDDAGTYTSLQLAFRNPVAIAEPEPPPYEDVEVHAFRGPVIEFTPLKPEPDEPPPRPPKRVRRPASAGGSDFKTSQTSVNSVLRPGKPLPVTREPSALASARSEPALPPAKKRSFFSRLFRRKEKSPAPSVRSEGRREARARPVGRSVSSASGVRPARFKSSQASLRSALAPADSITHISLHEDAPGTAPGPPAGAILVAESVLALDADSFRRLQDELELTDAEHYALYMAVAPRATASEFDEASCYYSPVDSAAYSS